MSSRDVRLALSRLALRRLALPCLALPGLALLWLAPDGGAQLISDTLVADINGAPAVGGSFDHLFASDGERVWFSAVDMASGEAYRVWSSDGTTAGTVQLSTLALNEHESVSAEDGRLFMLVDELGIGVALWSSDGSAAGTVEVLPPQNWTVAPYDLTAYGGAIWFLAGTAASGVEVWKSDLVTGTTGIAFELAAGSASGAADLFASATHLFVGTPLASAPVAATLLAGDGSPASFGTVATLIAPDAGTFDHVARFGNRVLFNVAGANASAGWWSSDGSAAGTLRVSSSLNDFWAVGAAGKAYFTAGPVSVSRLWETDGSLAGTLPVNDATSSGGQRVSFQYPGLAVGDDFYFGGLVAGLGFEPSRTSGAAAGSTLLLDVRPGSAGSDPSDFVAFGDKVLFRANDGVHGREIWVHSTTAATTELLADLTPGPAIGIPGSYGTLATAHGGVVFGQVFAASGLEPAVTDGLQTALLLNIAHDPSSAGSDPKHLVRLDNRVLFQAADATHGIELWASDGSTAGTVLVADIDPTPTVSASSGSLPHHLTRFGDRVVFFAQTPGAGRELWISDGTAAGTKLVADVIPGTGSSEPAFSAPPVVLGKKFYAILHEPGGALALFASDGTPMGTRKVMTTDPSGFLAEFVVLSTVGDHLVFNANLADAGVELWTSDGTAAGSELLVDAAPEGGALLPLVLHGDSRSFFSSIAGSEATIWRTDGTPAGTSAIVTRTIESFIGGPVMQTTLGDSLVYTAAEPGFGVEPWITDGTPGGTFMLADIAPGPASSFAMGFVASGDRAYFAVEAPPGSLHFQQVWSTDGTPGGTGLVIELPSPVSGAGVDNFWAPGDDGRMLFSNVDGNGAEWWITDGTSAGTRALTDIAPGGAFADPQPGVLLGDTLLFAADDAEAGLELHGLPYTVTGSFAANAIGDGCAGAFGAPTLSLAGGAPSVGESFTLAVGSAKPSATVYWLLGFGFGGHFPVGACSIELALPTILISTGADAHGAASLPLSVPASTALAGLLIDFQAFASEPGGPFLGLGTLTNVLEIVVGP